MRFRGRSMRVPVFLLLMTLLLPSQARALEIPDEEADAAVKIEDSGDYKSTANETLDTKVAADEYSAEKDDDLQMNGVKLDNGREHCKETATAVVDDDLKNAKNKETMEKKKEEKKMKKEVNESKIEGNSNTTHLGSDYGKALEGEDLSANVDQKKPKKSKKSKKKMKSKGSKSETTKNQKEDADLTLNAIVDDSSQNTSKSKVNEALSNDKAAVGADQSLEDMKRKARKEKKKRKKKAKKAAARKRKMEKKISKNIKLEVGLDKSKLNRNNGEVSKDVDEAQIGNIEKKAKKSKKSKKKKKSKGSKNKEENAKSSSEMKTTADDDSAKTGTRDADESFQDFKKKTKKSKAKKKRNQKAAEKKRKKNEKKAKKLEEHRDLPVKEPETLQMTPQDRIFTQDDSQVNAKLNESLLPKENNPFEKKVEL